MKKPSEGGTLFPFKKIRPYHKINLEMSEIMLTFVSAKRQ